jgi:hypothetical protein
MLYDYIYRDSQRGVLPAVFPLLLYSGKDNWTIPFNLRDLIDNSIPERYIPRFEYCPIIGRFVPDETLERLHNLVAAVIYMEKQADEEGIRKALDRVIDFLEDEGIVEIRAFMVWLTSLFRAAVPPAAIERIRDIKEATSMLTELAERIKREGKLEGKKEGKLETARRMQADGLSIAQICKYTGLSRKVVLASLLATPTEKVIAGQNHSE